MSTTPARPRSSGIPTPGRSSIPTPGRPRSSSSASSSHPTTFSADPHAIDRALVEAIKANDPARHSSAHSLSPQSTSYRRPTSVTSNTRPRTPTTTLSKPAYRRPDSRQSDVFTTRTSRSFEPGDNVRIESLGFEGTLRYLGEIRGKQGLWAGVELSGGFAGKGKNNGTVDGERYFECPPKCGVFVSTAKLSAPTVGPGAVHRPSSVASGRASLSGRITPSLSGRETPSVYGGRVTPSFSNGRITPSHSNGRVTPSSSVGFSTPSAAPRRTSKTPARLPPPALATPSAAAMSKITAGSRASKYVGMTAKQLSSRDSKLQPSGSMSPSRRSIGERSPTRSSGISSPMRSLGLGSPSLSSTSSTNSTPKAFSRMPGIGTPRLLGSGRPSLATPKARIPSAVAMPPPPSPPSSGTSRSVSLNDKPTTPTFSSTSNDTAVDDEVPENLGTIQQNGRAFRDKIQQIVSGNGSLSSGPNSPSALGQEPADEVSLVLRQSMEELKVKLDFAEQDNMRLQNELDKAQETANVATQVEVMRLQLKDATTRVSELESQLKANERSLKERDLKIESLERSAQTMSEAADRLRVENEIRARDLQAKLDDTENLTVSLKEAVEVKANEAGQNEGLLQAKNTEIGLLEARAKKAYAELEETRQELGAQVSELRQAGQETIALYEERLSAAETKQYELEDVIENLEERLKMQARPPSPTTMARHSSEAAQIDNEMLREQNSHLQKKVSSLEDMMEDVRTSAEKDEVAHRTRITRYKDNEIAIKKEVAELRKEYERIVKSEATARSRADEIEDALRENTLALENARAEIEVLRADLANLEGLQAGTSDRRGDAAPRATGRSAQDNEIVQLTALLDVSRVEKNEIQQQLETLKVESAETHLSLSTLRSTIERLDADKAELEEALERQNRKLEHDSVAHELHLDNREVDPARKSFNRDRPINNGLQEPGSPSSSKLDSNSTREEITGFKHIIQKLTNENASASAKNKLLESENKMLMSETGQLREELKMLEDSFEQSLLREERAIDSTDDGSSFSDDLQGLQKALRDAKLKHELELDQLRKKLTDSEMKTARTIHDLNKEVNELESLIEAKIYREDDLEREIERLKEKIARGKKSSKSSQEVLLADQRPRVTSSSSVSLSVTEHDDKAASGEVCEICEQHGHDIFTCPLLKDDGNPPAGKLEKTSNPSELFCEDCESHGHIAAECPHSLEVF